jgi:hypothetical protein
MRESSGVDFQTVMVHIVPVLSSRSLNWLMALLQKVEYQTRRCAAFHVIVQHDGFILSAAIISAGSTPAWPMRSEAPRCGAADLTG